MNPWDSGRMALRTLVGHRLRSGLTMLGIAIGNAAVIATIGIGEGATRFVTAEVSSLGPNVLFVRPGSPDAERRPILPPQTLVYGDAIAIKEQVPTVSAVAPELTREALVSFQGRNASTTVVGTTPDYLSVRGFDMAKGRFLTDLDLERTERVAVLGSELARQLFGDAEPLGDVVRVRNSSFRIVGVFQPKGSSFGMDMDMSLIAPVTTIGNQLAGRTSPFGMTVTFISISARSPEDLPAAKFQVENLLRLRHKIVDEDDFTVRSQKELQDTFSAVTRTLQIMLAAIASISLLVGGIGITNIMLVSVTERTQEIGLRKAIGAAPWDILTQFIIEATVLAALGGAIGTGVGISGIWLISATTTLEAEVSVQAIVLAVGVSGFLGLTFGTIPARTAAKLDPIDALRHG
ncbi:MAG: ABC transporter permease [Cyanobacteria bacterium P01_H01_bin.130]